MADDNIGGAGKSKPGAGFYVQDDLGLEKHREAGKDGGEKVKKEYGTEFYQQIGHEGGEKRT